MRIASHAVVAPRRRQSVHQYHLVVSPTQFVCCWWGVLLLQLLCATFLLVIGFVHLYIARGSVYPNVWLLRVPQPMLKIAGVSFVAVALPHLVAIARDMQYSFSCRRLTFRSTPRELSKQMTPSLASFPGALGPDKTAVTQNSRLAQIKDTVGRLWHEYFDASGECFEVGFCVRQAIEIAAQTYQAYLFSWAVPAVQLNRVLVALVLINCVYPTVLKTLLQHRSGAHRAAVLGLDLVIDITASVAIPLSILVPHMVEFDWANKMYPDKLRFNDVWFTKTLSEARQTMVTSPLDYMSSLVPLIAAIDSLNSLKVVLLRLRNEVVVSDASVDVTGSTPMHSALASAKPRSKIVRIFDRITVLWAIGVAIFQLQAEGRSSNTPTAICDLPMTPWFAHNMSCAVVDINCYRNGIRGSRAETTSILEKLDRYSLMRLLFSHCPELEIPSIITEFSYLQGVQTLNCSITEWPSSAAPSEKKQAKLAEVFLYDTNLTEFPRGLLQGDLPVHLSFVLHNSNLTQLPEHFGDACIGHTWLHFYLEHVPLTSLPGSFHHASVSSLTLYDTKIETIPDDLFHNQHFARLWISQNRLLSKLPSDVGSLDMLAILYAEHTNVSELPEWFDPWFKMKLSDASSEKATAFVSFYGSPLCNESLSSIPVELCGSVGSVETEDHRYSVVRSLRPV